MPQIVSQQTWKLSLPDSWVAEVDETCVSIYDPDGVGCIQVSTALKDTVVTKEDLLEWCHEQVPVEAKIDFTICGDFTGITCSYSAEKQAWRHWYLRSGRHMLFITYNCSMSSEGIEDDVINAILSSLSSTEATG